MIHIDARKQGAGKTTDMTKQFSDSESGSAYLLSQSYEHIDDVLLESESLKNTEFVYLKSLAKLCPTAREYKELVDMFRVLDFSSDKIHKELKCKDPECKYKKGEKIKPGFKNIAVIDMFLALIKTPENIRDEVFIDEADGLLDIVKLKYNPIIEKLETNKLGTVFNLGFYRIKNSKKLLEECKQKIKEEYKNTKKISKKSKFTINENDKFLLEVLSAGVYAKKLIQKEDGKEELHIILPPNIFTIFLKVVEGAIPNLNLNSGILANSIRQNEIKRYAELAFIYALQSLLFDEYKFEKDHIENFNIELFAKEFDKLVDISNNLNIKMPSEKDRVSKNTVYIVPVDLSTSKRSFNGTKNNPISDFDRKKKIDKELVSIIAGLIDRKPDIKIGVITFKDVKKFIEDIRDYWRVRGTTRLAFPRRNVEFDYFGNRMHGKTLDNKVDILIVYGDYTSWEFTNIIGEGKIHTDEHGIRVKEKDLLEVRLEPRIQALKRVRNGPVIYIGVIRKEEIEVYNDNNIEIRFRYLFKNDVQTSMTMYDELMESLTKQKSDKNIL